MQQRPISIMVFGILNIGYGLWKFATLMLSVFLSHMNVAASPAMDALKKNPAFIQWTNISTVAGVIFGIVLIAAGIGLLLLQNWARVLSMVYSVLEIIFAGASAVFTQIVIAPAMSSQFHGPSSGMIEFFTKVGFVLGFLIQLVYPVLLLIFMTRPKLIEAVKGQAFPVENQVQ
jgi:hypothetical protein